MSMKRDNRPPPAPSASGDAQERYAAFEAERIAEHERARLAAEGRRGWGQS